jgi:hypothetical protein
MRDNLEAIQHNQDLLDLGLMNMEAMRPIPTITSSTFQSSLPKAILIRG